MTPRTSSEGKRFWVVVADESIAVIYTRDSRSGPLHEFFSLDNETARKKMDELISDSGGRSYDSHGKGRHTMAGEKTDPKTHAAMAFAKEIAERIGKAMHDGSCRGFALVVAPRFLGILRDALSIATAAEPYASVDKLMVGQDTAAVEKLLTGL